MRARHISFFAVIGMFVAAAAAFAAAGELPPVSPKPDRILKGTAPTIILTGDKNTPGWKDINKVNIGGHVVAVQAPGADGGISLPLPKLNIVGRVDIEVIGKDDRPVASGQLNYVESQERSYNSYWILILYILIIAIPPAGSNIYDIYLSYRERREVLKLLSGNAKIAEVNTLLETMDKGPSGLTGLTRGTIAVTLILVLAVAIFHLVVFTPSDIPKIADQLLTLLAGTLTAITGFYFGSRTTAQAAAPSTSGPSLPKTGGAATPKITGFNPSDGAPAGRELEVIGEGFGDQQGSGTVTFDNTKVTDIKDWKDTSIKVTVPSGFTPGQDVSIVVTNGGGKCSEAKTVKIASPPARTDGLKTGGAATPKITGFNPSDGALAGRELEVIGEGFGDRQGNGTVTFDNTKVTDIKDWKDTSIKVTVPSGFTPGQDVFIVVTNGGGKCSEAKTFKIASPVGNEKKQENNAG